MPPADDDRRAARRDRLLGLAFAAAATIMLSAAFVSYRLVRALAATQRDAASQALARELILAASAARLVGATVLALAFLALRRHLAERRRIEAELTAARDAARRDAEARRLAQEETRRYSERLHAVLDQVDAGVVLFEPDGRIAFFNRAAERVHGAWRDEVERVYRAGTHPPLRPDGKTPIPPGEEPLALALKGEAVRDARVFLRTPFRPNGFLLAVNAAPMRSAQGLATAAVLVFRELA